MRWAVAVESFEGGAPGRAPVSTREQAERVVSRVRGLWITGVADDRGGVFKVEMVREHRILIPASEEEYGPGHRFVVPIGLKTYIVTPVPPGEAADYGLELQDERSST